MEYVLMVVFMLGTDTFRGPEFRQGVAMQEFKTVESCQVAAKHVMEMATKVHPALPQGARDPKIVTACVLK